MNTETLDFRFLYRQYFFARKMMQKVQECKDIIRSMNQNMSQVIYDNIPHINQDMDLTWASYSIWPFGKGMKVHALLRAYLNCKDHVLSGFNPKALKKILGTEKIFSKKSFSAMFQSRKQFHSFNNAVKNSGKKITRLKNLSLLAVDSFVILANIYIHRIESNTCKILFVFKQKDCFINRCSEFKVALLKDHTLQRSFLNEKPHDPCDKKTIKPNNVYDFIKK